MLEDTKNTLLTVGDYLIKQSKGRLDTGNVNIRYEVVKGLIEGMEIFTVNGYTYIEL